MLNERQTNIDLIFNYLERSSINQEIINNVNDDGIDLINGIINNNNFTTYNHLGSICNTYIDFNMGYDNGLCLTIFIFYIDEDPISNIVYKNERTIDIPLKKFIIK